MMEKRRNNGKSSKHLSKGKQNTLFHLFWYPLDVVIKRRAKLWININNLNKARYEKCNKRWIYENWCADHPRSCLHDWMDGWMEGKDESRISWVRMRRRNDGREDDRRIRWKYLLIHRKCLFDFRWSFSWPTQECESEGNRRTWNELLTLSSIIIPFIRKVKWNPISS